MRRIPVAALIIGLALCGHAVGASFACLTAGDVGMAAASGEAIEFYKLIVAGDPWGVPPDSPEDRIDPNVATSRFAGVGSVRADMTGGYYFGTGTLVSSRHVLTAAHVVDIDDDGVSDFSADAVSFYLNNGASPTVIKAEAVEIYPTYTGFNNPAVNDDLALITLAEAVAPNVPSYSLWTGALAAGHELIQVGYGRSGSGSAGYTVRGSLTVKRVGRNVMDVMLADDDAGGGNGVLEVWRADFDGPTAGTNVYGGPTLGNDIESTLGPGDSGGPSFIEVDGQLQIVGINTFGFSVSGAPQFPFYGSGMGGILVGPYADWVNTAIPSPPTMALIAAGLPALVFGRKARCKMGSQRRGA